MSENWRKRAEEAEARLRGRADATSDAAYWMRRAGNAEAKITELKTAYINTGVELTWTHAWALAANIRRESAESIVARLRERLGTVEGVLQFYARDEGDAYFVAWLSMVSKDGGKRARECLADAEEAQ